MNIRTFWVCAMEFMCAQTRPRFILSSQRICKEWSQKPCQLQENNALYRRLRGESNLRCWITQDSEPNTLLTELFWPPRQSLKWSPSLKAKQANRTHSNDCFTDHTINTYTSLLLFCTSEPHKPHFTDHHTNHTSLITRQTTLHWSHNKPHFTDHTTNAYTSLCTREPHNHFTDHTTNTFTSLCPVPVNHTNHISLITQQTLTLHWSPHKSHFTDQHTNHTSLITTLHWSPHKPHFTDHHTNHTSLITMQTTLHWPHNKHTSLITTQTTLHWSPHKPHFTDHHTNHTSLITQQTLTLHWSPHKPHFTDHTTNTYNSLCPVPVNHTNHT